MKKKIISTAAVIVSILCIADGFIDLGLSSSIINRYLNGYLGVVYLTYGILIHTKYENIANGILCMILGGISIFEFTSSTWAENPFRFFDLIIGICIIGIGAIFLLPVKADE